MPSQPPRRSRPYSPGSIRFPVIVEPSGERILIVKKYGAPQGPTVLLEAEDGKLYAPADRTGHVRPVEEAE